MGGNYKDEETAARASDTLARQLLYNGEKGHKLNFTYDRTEVHSGKKLSSKYIGVNYNKRDEIWRAQRYDKNEKKLVTNGTYKDEVTAAYASDTLARELIANGEPCHKLNFPDDHTEVWSEKMKTSKFTGVYYSKRDENWYVQRRSRDTKKAVYNGYYKDEEIAAHASDTLARKLMNNGEKKHKLNFPDDHTEVWAEKYQRNKRKRSNHEDLRYLQNK